MLGINLKTVSLNSEIIAELIENGEAENIVRQKILSARKRNQIFRTTFPWKSFLPLSETDNIATPRPSGKRGVGAAGIAERNSCTWLPPLRNAEWKQIILCPGICCFTRYGRWFKKGTAAVKKYIWGKTDEFLCLNLRCPNIEKGLPKQPLSLFH